LRKFARRKIDIYCHHALKAELEDWRTSSRIIGPTILTRYDGRPLSYNRLRNKAEILDRSAGVIFSSAISV
jgi:hypothetical protein